MKANKASREEENKEETGERLNDERGDEFKILGKEHAGAERPACDGS